MSELPDELDVEYQLTRFVRRVRMSSLNTLGDIHPQLDYGAYLFFIAICDAQTGIRASELAERLQVHKSTASRAIASLSTLDLIDRVPDPDDGRAQLLVASPEARERLQIHRVRRRERFAHVLEGWAEGELQQLALMLDRLNDAAERAGV